MFIEQEGRENMDVRRILEKAGIKHYRLAYKLGIDVSTLSRWLQTPLTDTRRCRIMEAINELSV